MSIADLQKPPEPAVRVQTEEQEPVVQSSQMANPPSQDGNDGDFRAMLHRLVDSLDDRELNQIQVPASALLRLMRGKA